MSTPQSIHDACATIFLCATAGAPIILILMHLPPCVNFSDDTKDCLFFAWTAAIPLSVLGMAVTHEK